MAPSILGLASAILGIPTITTFIQNLISALTRNSEYIENVQCTRNQLQEFEDEDLLGKMSILLTPTGYSDGSLNTIIPPYSLSSELIDLTQGTAVNPSDWSNITTNSVNYLSSATTLSYFDVDSTQGTLISGKKYSLTLEISNYSGTGDLGISTQGNVSTNARLSTDGIVKEVFVSNGQSLRIFGRSTNSATINLSVKEIQEADFDFSRGSSATRVNEQGLVEDVQILSGELVQNGNFAEEGSELVTNGNFDNWTADNPDSWTVLNEDANNYVTQDGTYARIVSDDTASIQIKQTIFTIGKIYKVELDAVVNSGNVEGLKLNDATAPATIGYVNSTGHHTFYFKAAGTAFVINRKGGGDTDISIDNVSVKEVGQNWVFGTGWSMGDGKVVADGTMTSSDTLNQSYNFTDGNKYRFQFTVSDYQSGSVYIREPFDGLSDAVSSNGTFTFDYIVGTANEIRFRSNDGFTGSLDNVSFKEVTDDTDLPRIDYSPYSGAGTCGHLLLEPQSTNIVTYSEDFRSNSNFNTNAPSSIFESGYLAPDGTLTATRINGFDGYYVALSNTGSGQARSIYVKSGNGQIGNVNLLDPNYQAHSLFEVTNEWKRVELVGSDTWFYIVDGRGASLTLDDVIVWGLQQENLSYATSYIPTSGTTVTRSAETANNSGNADLFNDSEGVLYAEIAALADVAVNRAISISDGSGNNRVNILYSTSSNQIRVIVMVGGSTQFDTSYSVTSVKDNHKVALKYKANDFALWIDGIERATDTSGTIYPQNTLNKLAFNVGSGIFPFYGKTKALAVFKEALSNDELELLTGEGYNSFAALAAAYNYNVI